MHDVRRREPVAENSSETGTDLPDLGRDGLARDPEVEVPVEVEVVLVVRLHQRFAGVGVVEETSEESADLARVLCGIEVRRGCRGIDLLPRVVRSTLLVALDE